MKAFSTRAFLVCLIAGFAPSALAAEGKPRNIFGFDVPIGTDALPWFELPNAANILDGAVDRYEQVSIEIAGIKPQLEQLGFAVSNFKTQLFPPAVRLRLVSKNGASNRGLIDLPTNSSMVAALILKSAMTAKNVQSALGLQVVVMDIVVGTSPSIKVSYLDVADQARLIGQLQDIRDDCSGGQ